MKVLLISGEFPPMRGGVADYTAVLGQSLIEQGCQVSVVTSTRAALASEEQGLASGPTPDVMPSIDNWGFESVRREVAPVVEALRPDIVQIQYQTGAYGMQIGINLLPWLLRRKTARPRLVVTFHDLKEPYLLPKVGPARHLATVVLAAGGDAIVVTNHEDFRRVASVVDPNRTRPVLGCHSLAAIPIGSNIPRGPADFDRDAWREHLGAAASDFVIGFFGFLVPSKGVETLIAAFEALLSDGRSVRLAMVGASAGDTDIGGDSYAAQIRRRLASPVLRDRVSWTGFAAADAVASYLRACDAVCLPFREGASLRHGTLAAAIAQGLPIVTSRSEVDVTGSGLPELRDGENVLLVRRGDAVELTRALARLADDPALRDRLKVNVSNVAVQLDWRTIAEQHVALYRRLMAK